MWQVNTFCHGDGRVFSSVQFSSLSHIWLFATPWTTARQASLSITNSQSSLKFMSIDSVMPSNHLILCQPFSSCLQSFPASGSFPVSQFFTSCGQSIGASTSATVLPMNTQDWFPLGWTGWIFLQSKGPPRVFSDTTVQKHQLFSTQFLYSSTLTSIYIHSYIGKTIALISWTFARKVVSLLFNKSYLGWS